MQTNESVNDGGPAFPMQEFSSTVGANEQAHYGMSLRAYFAGKACAGRSADKEGSFASRAKWCVQMADALIAELNKPKT